MATVRTMSDVESLVKKGRPSWEAHELVLDAIPDERLEDPISDEAILNFAVAGQLQPCLVRANGRGVEVVEGRQRVKRALVINHLAGRHEYDGELKSVKDAIARLTGSPIGKRVVEEAPKGIKVLVTVHHGDEKEAQRAAIAANEHRADDPLDRKIRKAKRLARQGFSEAEIALDFGVSRATAKRWIASDTSKERKQRGKNSTAPSRAKLGSAFEKLTKSTTDAADRWRVLFGWLTGKPHGEKVYTRADVIGEFPELGPFIGGK